MCTHSGQYTGEACVMQAGKPLQAFCILYMLHDVRLNLVSELTRKMGIMSPEKVRGSHGVI